MLRVVAPIVEGDGEVAALPILLRRLNEWLRPEQPLTVMQPIRVRRDRFIRKDDEFRRHLLLAAAKCGPNGWVLILLDADDDCPAILGQTLLERASAIAPHRPVSVVLANREYESWFIAAARSLDGHRTFELGEQPPADAELNRDAKGWIKRQMRSRSYGETTDQPALTARMDISQAFERSRSFRKLCADVKRMIFTQPKS